ncbi:MAG: glutaredoxin family protein [Acidobacteriota bacterium]
METPTATVFFYTRPNCHLCEEALSGLEQLLQQYDFRIEKVDISTSAKLEERYGTRTSINPRTARAQCLCTF